MRFETMREVLRRTRSVHLLAVLLILFAAATAKAQGGPPCPPGFPFSVTGFDCILQILEDGRDTVTANEPVDGTNQAEGLRHLLRLTEFAFNEYEQDPLHPRISRCPGGICKIGFDSPDQTQISVNPLALPYSYRVFGNLESADVVTFQLIDPVTFAGPTIASDDMVVGADGSYELVIAESNTTGAPNFLPLTAAGGQLIVRVIFADWANEIEPSVEVEVTNADPGSTPIPTLTPPQFLGDSLFTAGQVQGILNTFSTLPFNLFMQDLTNGGSFPPPGTPLIPGSPAGQAFSLSTNAKYDLPTNMAIIIERDPADVRAGNIQLGNRWLESLDYRSRLVSHNLFQSYQDSDGKYRYVIAHEDPGVPNWLDTRDHQQGTVFLRWLKPADPNALVAPNVKVVPLDELRDPGNLPADHPFVTAAERSAELVARSRAVNRRMSPAGFATFKDADGDGEHNAGDQCADTPLGEEVDTAGCSQEQFCSLYVGELRSCRKADWMNDEPGAGNPKDCRDRQQGSICEVY
jgi:hypothetical protein